MNSKKWTNSQIDAIKAGKGSILVSAAAGSGKTAVLVQRVINKITDENNPIDIDRLLIVTFTKAAATQMKERISEKLSELILLNPKNKRLKRQQLLLNNANISTVHKFCSDIVRENFYKLGVSSDFRIASAGEVALIKEEAVAIVLNELYKSKDAEFYKMVEALSNVKDDKTLVDIIYNIYNFIRSYPFPERWLDEKLKLYNYKEEISNTIWAKVIFEYAASALDCHINLIKDAINLLNDNIDIKNAYNDAFCSDLALLHDINKSVRLKNFSNVYKKVNNANFEPLKRLRGYSNDPLKNRVCEMRKQVKNIILKLQKLFTSTQQQCLMDIKKVNNILKPLFNAVKLFMAEMNKIKRLRNVVDFCDLEHLALSLLIEDSKDGIKKSKEAEVLSEKFDEIMVDEYQDTNEIQDIIFRAISKNEKNIFVVGDVKQSIYGFRQAMPEIFLHKKENLTNYNKEKDNYPAKIILDKNFRSRKGIINFVNFIFSQLMSKKTSEMEYNDEEKLKYGAQYKADNEPDVSIELIETYNSEEDADIIEARHIADIILNRIHSGQMIKDGDEFRKITYRDFAILIRSANNHALNYAKELNILGVPAYSDAAGSFFKTKEISTMLSLLRVIDNPIQDIPLISVLLSPVFAFTPDDLSKIRLKDKNSPIYFAVKKSAENNNKKCISFIESIDDYRRVAATVKTDVLINYIYEKTGYTSMVRAMRGGELRLSNLRLFFNYAKEYESFGAGRLSGFIGFIDKLQQQNEDMTPATALSESSNVVRVMSIHHSKGLEFPICILAGCARKFNKEKDEIVMHSGLGVGTRIKDAETMVKYSNMPLEAILSEIDKEQTAEELRVLYVALTRAKEKLFIVNSVKDIEKTLYKISSRITQNKKISPYFIKNATSFSDWILMCVVRHPFGAELRKIANIYDDIVVPAKEAINVNIVKPKQKLSQKKEESLKDDKILLDSKFLNVLYNRLNFEYSAFLLHNIPSKVSASGFLLKENKMSDEYVKTVPAFLKNEKVTPTDRGTAIHKFLQFADYKSAQKDIKLEINRLLEKGFLSKEEIKYIDITGIKKFFKSDIFKRILNADKISREYRFNACLKAGDIESLVKDEFKNETIILQGAVDCIFFEDNEIVIVDYKTDKLKDEKSVISKHKRQVELYKYGVNQCMETRVKECYVYSFKMGKAIKI